jgi:hypothetical protein
MNEECKKPYLKLVREYFLLPPTNGHIQDEIRPVSKKGILTIFSFKHK